MLDRQSFVIHNTPAAPSVARRHVGEALSSAPREIVDVVTLLFSELATNCVRYVDTDFTMSIERTPDSVRVDIVDGRDGGVTMRRPTPDEPTGRGLRIVDELADRWGVSDAVDSGGKSVWFTIRLS